MSKLLNYTKAGKNRIEGWFAPVDARTFYELLTFQNENNIDGGVAEIGVHHGKSFVALCLALVRNQVAYGIDIFDKQDLNVDQSGGGDLEILKNNLEVFGLSERLPYIKIDHRSSQQVSALDIKKATGGVRFFSVDGGHWREIVRNDLELAAETLSDDGIIALDDFLRPEWPDVSIGYCDWFEQSLKDKVPFAIGFNKLYICHLSKVKTYQDVLTKSPFLRYFVSKQYELYGRQVPIFQRFMLPEFSLRKRIVEFVKLYYPDTYVTLKNKLG